MDWHTADIKAAISKKNTSLAELARKTNLRQQLCEQLCAAPTREDKKLLRNASAYHLKQFGHHAIRAKLKIEPQKEHQYE